MSRQIYLEQSTPPARRASWDSGRTSFRSSASPDEDWTKISDPVQRRRVQNRLAQRKYRKRLQERLKDLEEQVATPKGTSTGNEKPGKPASTRRNRKPKEQGQTLPVLEPTSLGPSTPHMDEPSWCPFIPRPSEETTAYSAYPTPPGDVFIPVYGAVQRYPSLPTEPYPEALMLPAPVAVHLTTNFDEAVAPDLGFPYAPTGESFHSTSYNDYLPGDTCVGQPWPYEWLPHA